MISPNEMMLNLIVQCKADILVSVTGHEHEALSLMAISGLTQIENKLRFHTGQQIPAQITQAFLPVTNFMGEPVNRPVDIVSADLRPTLTEREIYVMKVDRLQKAFAIMQSENIINSYSMPEDLLVLRGVAKRANLQDAANGTINIDFIERIKAGLIKNDDDILEEQAINRDLLNQSEVSQNNEIVQETGDIEELYNAPIKTSSKKAK